MRAAALLMLALCGATGCGGAGARPSSGPISLASLPTPQQVIASKADLWGEAALRQPGGSSYDFFASLLPPLRYVDADFHYYPIVLSAPGARVKGRLVSTGSQINALARQPNWTHEQGTPVRILIGARREPFGSDVECLRGPEYADGYLPIVHLWYQQAGQSTGGRGLGGRGLGGRGLGGRGLGGRGSCRAAYGQEVFASVDPNLSASGAILARFDFPAADRGRIELRFESGDTSLSHRGNVICDQSGRVLAALDDNWEFNPFRNSLTSKPKHAVSAVVMIFTVPASSPILPSTIDLAMYERQRAACAKCWEDLLADGTQISVGEPIVNDAWRALLLQQHEILRGDHLNYSASNQYARMYSNECGDSMRSLLLFGHFATARKVIGPLFVYRRPNIELHDAAFKLQLLADYYFQTRDATLIREIHPLWQREVDLILNSRDKTTGLLPREKYCSDIATPVHSLNANANCWRGMRDMSIVLDEIGEKAQASQLAASCAIYRKQILDVLNHAIVRSVDPPFIPVALGGEEPPHDPITATRMGSYWGLVIPCVLWSGVFSIDSPPASDIMRYIRTNGGLCMGMTRVQSAPGVWMNVQNIDDLYTLRYQLALLKRDGVHDGIADVDRALVGFYGKLAQGMTRDTFIDGESSGIIPLDRFGRQMYLPPNSTANASFLIQLRHLLVQDWDKSGDGRADTLRLAFATPRRWLADGKQIIVRDAPTRFGKVSFLIRSNLSKGRIEADVKLPDRALRSIHLRLRLPEGWEIIAADTNGSRLGVRQETLDLSGCGGNVQVTATVAQNPRQGGLQIGN